MTGIERLRGYARRMDELHVWPGGARLREIAGQIEREHDAEVADSPYDAILPEDREAAAWVRDHGGLDAVRSEWSSRVPYDKHEQRRQRLLGHIAECETALRRRNARIEGLGHRVSDLTRENAELRRRAMPEGMEWPKFEDGEPVRIGDEFAERIYGERCRVGHFAINKHAFLIFDDDDVNDCEAIDHGTHKRVRRPAPKVLDADGESIKVGDVMWSLTDGRKHEVTGIDPIVKEIRIKDESMELGVWVAACGLTHAKPEPPKRCRDCAHWQKDPNADKMGVCWFFYHEHEGQDCYPARLGDIGACEEFMPRVIALAERERGER